MIEAPGMAAFRYRTAVVLRTDTHDRLTPRTTHRGGRVQAVGAWCDEDALLATPNDVANYLKWSKVTIGAPKPRGVSRMEEISTDEPQPTRHQGHPLLSVRGDRESRT